MFSHACDNYLQNIICASHPHSFTTAHLFRASVQMAYHHLNNEFSSVLYYLKIYINILLKHSKDKTEKGIIIIKDILFWQLSELRWVIVLGSPESRQPSLHPIHMIDWPPGYPFQAVFHEDAWMILPDSKPWATSSPFISKGSPFHQVKVQTSREFCVAPKSPSPLDDESSLPGSEMWASTQQTCMKRKKCYLGNVVHNGIFGIHFQWKFYVGWEIGNKFSLDLVGDCESYIFILFIEIWFNLCK